MIKLNRTTEYGLMALRLMSQKRQEGPSTSCDVTSAREVAESFGLPFEITAKTLQRLKETGLIQSAQGARGGYTLHRAMSEVSLAEFLQLMEGPQSVVACVGSVKSSQSEPCVSSATLSESPPESTPESLRESLVEISSKNALKTSLKTLSDVAKNGLADSSKCCCAYEVRCGIRSVLGDLNTRVLGFLSGIRLSELTESDAWAVLDESTPKVQEASTRREG